MTSPRTRSPRTKELPMLRRPRALALLARLKAAGALDPSGKSKDVGVSLKIEIELSGTVIGNGVQGKVRGTKYSNEGSTATLIVPVQGARGASEALVWHLTWQK